MEYKKITQNTYDQKMKVDLMHEWIDRQNQRFRRSTVTATNWKTRLEGYNLQNEMETVSIEEPRPIE